MMRRARPAPDQAKALCQGRTRGRSLRPRPAGTGSCFGSSASRASRWTGGSWPGALTKGPGRNAQAQEVTTPRNPVDTQEEKWRPEANSIRRHAAQHHAEASGACASCSEKLVDEAFSKASFLFSQAKPIFGLHPAPVGQRSEDQHGHDAGKDGKDASRAMAIHGT